MTRRPLPDEVGLDIFQYATGDHALPIVWAEDETPLGPIYNLGIDRPFEYRIEPRWRGGSETLDVIFEVKVHLNITDSDDLGDSAWTQLTHLGPQTRNREMAQIGQHVTLSRGDLLHPFPGGPLLWTMGVDFQLGAQNGPKLVGAGRVRVWNVEDPAFPGDGVG